MCTGMVGLWAFIGCGIVAITILMVTAYGFKNTGTRLVPRSLKHTWLAGLGCVTATYVNFAVPYIFLGDPYLTAASFIFTTSFLILFGRRFFEWMRNDLRIHKFEGRGLFEHSEDCVMVGGRRDTFLEKELDVQENKERNSQSIRYSMTDKSSNPG